MNFVAKEQHLFSTPDKNKCHHCSSSEGKIDHITGTGNDFLLQFRKSFSTHIWYKSALVCLLIMAGQELWVKRLKWEGLPEFTKLRWTPLDDPSNPGITGAFYKTYKNFTFYWILKAGHMVRDWGRTIDTTVVFHRGVVMPNYFRHTLNTKSHFFILWCKNNSIYPH